MYSYCGVVPWDLVLGLFSLCPDRPRHQRDDFKLNHTRITGDHSLVTQVEFLDSSDDDNNNNSFLLGTCSHPGYTTGLFLEILSTSRMYLIYICSMYLGDPVLRIGSGTADALVKAMK